MRKYKNSKVKTSEGLVFDSKREYRRWCELKMMEASGVIINLQRQVKYVLIPAQREPDIIGKRGGKIKGKLVERECSYIADFVYKTADGETIAEDVKGYKKGGAYAVFSIKRKLMLQLYNIRIREV